MCLESLIDVLSKDVVDNNIIKNIVIKLDVPVPVHLRLKVWYNLLQIKNNVSYKEIEEFKHFREQCSLDLPNQVIIS